MNTKTLLLAGALGLGWASLADAQQYVYLSGSTAARFIVDATLKDGSGTSVFDAAPTVVYQGGSSSANATYVDYSGNIGSTPYIIKCHWSGSEGGLADLNGTTEQFLDDTAVTGGSGPYIPPRAVDLAMADNAVLFSRSPNAPVTGVKVGVIAFEWVKEKGSSASLTNVTDESIRQAIAGNARLALFTGNPSDLTHVYVTGRNNDSGTRVNSLGSSRFGIFTIPNQLQVNSDGSMVNQGTVNNPIYLGDYGYSGGGGVAAQMGYDLSQASSKDVAPLGDGTSHFSVIGYLGNGDAASAISAGGTALSYNGIPYSIQALEQGQYNFWGNEYLYHVNSAGSAALTVYGKMAASTGVAGHADDNILFSLSHMQASRTGPTSDPVHN